VQNTFDHKLNIGLAGETLTRYYLEKVLKKKVEQSQGFDRAKDMLVSGVPVEVKTHPTAASSGNLCLEHRSYETHTAGITIHLVPTFYWAWREKERQFISYWPDQVGGGDDGRKQTLVKIGTETFAEIFRRLN
jgi:hypothetical protein